MNPLSKKRVAKTNSSLTRRRQNPRVEPRMVTHQEPAAPGRDSEPGTRWSRAHCLDQSCCCVVTAAPSLRLRPGPSRPLNRPALPGEAEPRELTAGDVGLFAPGRSRGVGAQWQEPVSDDCGRVVTPTEGARRAAGLVVEAHQRLGPVVAGKLCVGHV